MKALGGTIIRSACALGAAAACLLGCSSGAPSGEPDAGGGLLPDARPSDAASSRDVGIGHDGPPSGDSAIRHDVDLGADGQARADAQGIDGSSSLKDSAASSGDAAIAFNEPAGMTTEIDTGPMGTPPATTYPANTWMEGGATFTNFSPTTISSTGELDTNLASVPDGTGLRVTYAPSLAGGNSPVRFGTPIPDSGTGSIYLRWRFRFSPNWTLSQASGLKVMEPRTVNTGSENHVLGYGGDTAPTDGWLGALLQFNTADYYACVPGNALGQQLDPPTGIVGPAANLGGGERGTWHWSEVFFKAESTAGAEDGQITLWVDGGQVFQSGAPGSSGTPNGGVHFFLAGESMGWNYLMFDPTYGGDAATDHPPYDIWWDIDQIFVSVK